MNKIYILIFASVFLLQSCRSIKRYTNKGDYEEAVDYAISKFDKNKSLKTKEIKYLEKAHAKLVNEEVAKVRRKAIDPSYTYKSVYADIAKIDRVQKKLNPYLPIVSKDGYRSKFSFISVGKLQEDAFKDATRLDLLSMKDFEAQEEYLKAYRVCQNIVNRQQFLRTNELIVGVDGYVPNIITEDISENLLFFKGKAVSQLYDNALADMDKYQATRKKTYASRAFNDLNTLDKIDSNYKDTHRLIEEARDMATLHVLVSMENRTFNLLPIGFKFDIVNRGFNDLENEWVRYYNDERARKEFDVISILELNQLDISDNIEEATTRKLKKRVKDGWEYVLDEKGNVAKDSLGNDIKQDVFKTIKGRFTTIDMRKFAKINARVVYHNVATGQTNTSRDLDVEYVFENEDFAFKGDRRLLDGEMLECLNRVPPSFPSDSEILQFAADLLKDKFNNELDRRIYYDRWFK